MRDILFWSSELGAAIFWAALAAAGVGATWKPLAAAWRWWHGTAGDLRA